MRVQHDVQRLHPHLPFPPADALSLSEQLHQQLIAHIEQSGDISFADFMQQVLYAAGLGYYSAGLAKLGAEGDFVTAPEMSSLFSHSIARAVMPILQKPGRSVLELGAGRGTMAADMLHFWQQNNCLPEQYFILDVSADLRAVQQQTLAQCVPDLISRVQWLSELPTSFDGVVIGNEVLDAMPVCLFHRKGTTLFERRVAVKDHRFVWHDHAAPSILQNWFSSLPAELISAWPESYVSEYIPALPSWIQALSSSLNNAVILLIDYGFVASEFFLPERCEGTLMCHYRHHAHANPLCLIGLQDITTHINFSEVAEHADQAGLSVCGFTSQAAFLQNNDILRAATIGDSTTQFRHAQALKRLLLPSEMGEIFKVMALSKGLVELPDGFEYFDRRHQL